MRRIAIFLAALPALTLAPPASAHDGHRHMRDRAEQQDEQREGFHRYYGSEYGGTADGARERAPDQRRWPRPERPRDHAPPPSVPPARTI